MYKAGDGTGEDGLCIDIVGWHAVQGEAGKKLLQTMVLCYIIMLYILHQNPNLYQKNPNLYWKNPNPTMLKRQSSKCAGPRRVRPSLLEARAQRTMRSD